MQCEEGMTSSNFFLPSKYRIFYNTYSLVTHNIFAFFFLAYSLEHNSSPFFLYFFSHNHKWDDMSILRATSLNELPKTTKALILMEGSLRSSPFHRSWQFADVKNKQTSSFSLFARQKANHAKHDRWSKKQNLMCSDKILVGITLHCKTATKPKKGRLHGCSFALSPHLLHCIWDHFSTLQNKWTRADRHANFIP